MSHRGAALARRLWHGCAGAAAVAEGRLGAGASGGQRFLLMGACPPKESQHPQKHRLLLMEGEAAAWGADA